jgi:hypothetical protein
MSSERDEQQNTEEYKYKHVKNGYSTGVGTRYMKAESTGTNSHQISNKQKTNE